MSEDPLVDFWETPPEAQLALLVSVIRATRREMGELRNELRWVKRAMWSLVATIIAAVVINQINLSRPQIADPTKASPPIKAQK